MSSSWDPRAMEAAAGVEGLVAARLARPGMTTGGGGEVIGVALVIRGVCRCFKAGGLESRRGVAFGFTSEGRFAFREDRCSGLETKWWSWF